jgi:hypothetical protein
MTGMLTAPGGEGRQGKQAAEQAQRVIGTPRPEKRAMAAIVLDDEDPHQEPGCHHYQGQRDPVGYFNGQIHGRASAEKSAE